MRLEKRFGFLHRSSRAITGFRARMELSVAATVAFVAGLATLGATLIVFGGVTEDVTRHNGASTTDALHLHWFVEHRSPALDTAARWFTVLGSPAMLALVVAISAAFLWWHGRQLLLALAPGLALGLAGGSAAIGKLVVARSRPPVALHLVAESDASFPSGHATNATAVFLTLALVVAVYVLRSPLARTACVAISGLTAAAVGISRLVLGVHWPTDIVAGWSLGASVALAVTLGAGLIARATPTDQTSAANQTALRRVTHLLRRERQSKSLQAA